MKGSPVRVRASALRKAPLRRSFLFAWEPTFWRGGRTRVARASRIISSADAGSAKQPDGTRRSRLRLLHLAECDGALDEDRPLAHVGPGEGEALARPKPRIGEDRHERRVLVRRHQPPQLLDLR